MFFKKNKKLEKPYKNILGDNEREEKMFSIINYFVDGLLVFDGYSKLILINPQAEKILGVKREQVLGEEILRLTSFPNFKPLISLLGGDIKESSKEECKIGRNVFEVSAIPMIEEPQKIGTLVILRDITRERLVETMKSEFVTLAAHQLRTPASAIKWSLRTLLDGDLGELPEKQKNIVEETYQANEKVIQLINDLLNVARIEEGKFLSKLVLSDVVPVIQSVIDLYSEEIEKKKLKFEFKKPKEKISEIMLDVDKMKIAVANLVDNAVRYTPPGGRITISLEKKEKEIKVQIQDNGLGIPESQQEKVFSKFFRAENVMKVETEGTGLGLFIARYIIEAHGGRIWFESEEDEGTIFYFTLPVKEQFAEYLTREFY